MTLEELRLKLVSAATGTDVAEVLFDYSSQMNANRDKTYPLALWDFDNMRILNWDMREGTKVLVLRLFVFQLTTPENDVVKRHQVWDTIIEDIEAYVASIQGQADLSVENTTELSGDFYPAGLWSLEREMAVGLEIELKMWC